MRALALDQAGLERGQKVLDAGAGTGFTTEGIVARVHPADVTMLDQSPHQLARSRTKPALADCERVLGDAENLPFADDTFDRYVSARARSSTGRTRSAASPRPTAWCEPVPALWSSARCARPTASRGRWPRPGCSSRRSTSTGPGWRPRASRTCASPSWRPTGTATAAPRTRWRSAGSSPARARPPRRRRDRRRPRPGRADVRVPVRRRLGRGRAVHPARDRPDPARPRGREEGAMTRRRRAPRRPRLLAAGAARVTIAATHARANPLGVLWRFARPHTIIGTALSVAGLWAISENARGVGDLAATLLVGLMVNVAIVGVNQITDVEIDRINKPFLPIAAGELSPAGARAIVVACTVVPSGPGGHAGDVRDGRGRRRARGRRAVLAAAVPAQAVPGRGVAVHHGRAFARRQPRRLLAFRRADRSAGVGAVPVRAAVQLRDRRAQGRAGHRGGPRVQHPHVHGPARRPARVPESAWPRWRSPTRG